MLPKALTMTPRLRRYLSGMILCIGFACLPGLSASAAGNCTLRFVWVEFAPFHFLDESGAMQGIDHAMVMEAGRRLGCGITWEQTLYPRALTMVEEGRADAMAGLTRTPDREVFGLYSAPLRHGSNVLVVRKGEAGRHRFATLAELADTGFRLGVVRGARYSADYEAMLESGRLADNLVLVNSPDIALTMLVRGRVDGIVDGQQALAWRARRLGLADRIEVHPMKVANNTAHVLFSRRVIDPALVERFNAVLLDMAVDGTVQAIQERWIR